MASASSRLRQAFSSSSKCGRFASTCYHCARFGFLEEAYNCSSENCFRFICPSLGGANASSN